MVPVFSCYPGTKDDVRTHSVCATEMILQLPLLFLSPSGSGLTSSGPTEGSSPYMLAIVLSDALHLAFQAEHIHMLGVAGVFGGSLVHKVSPQHWLSRAGNPESWRGYWQEHCSGHTDRIHLVHPVVASGKRRNSWYFRRWCSLQLAHP